MILFYNKNNGEIFSFVDGRVHDQRAMKVSVNSGNITEEKVGKMVIGWEETDELLKIEKTIDKVEDYELDYVDDDGEEYYKKVIKMREIERPIYKKIEHNLDKFELLQRFEDATPENPMDYKIDLENNNLIKK